MQLNILTHEDMLAMMSSLVCTTVLSAGGRSPSLPLPTAMKAGQGPASGRQCSTVSRETHRRSSLLTTPAGTLQVRHHAPVLNNVSECQSGLGLPLIKIGIFGRDISGWTEVGLN